jgi:hypothetical protein
MIASLAQRELRLRAISRGAFRDDTLGMRRRFPNPSGRNVAVGECLTV